MKLVLAQMKHETNTFSPVPTPLARFGHGRDGPREGREAHEEFKGTGTALGAFIDLAERAGAEIVLPVAAQAWPSGRLAQEAFEHIAGRIVRAGAQAATLHGKSEESERSAARSTGSLRQLRLGGHHGHDERAGGAARRRGRRGGGVRHLRSAGRGSVETRGHRGARKSSPRR